MAEGIRFQCSACGTSIEAWSDGNPYEILGDGTKRYVYHPQDTSNCVGNDTPHLCLSCGTEFMVDSRTQGPTACPTCDGVESSPTWLLGGLDCPKCLGGRFERDPDFHAIS